MKLSTIVNIQNEVGGVDEKELSVEVANNVAYFKLDGKDLFEIDFEGNLDEFISSIMMLWGGWTKGKSTVQKSDFEHSQQIIELREQVYAVIDKVAFNKITNEAYDRFRNELGHSFEKLHQSLLVDEFTKEGKKP
jgi:hypothetical protein